MLSFAGVVLGVTLLIVGGGLLVRGASEIAAGFGISPMIIGLTVVGFGTSSPELVVNVVGAINGTTDIAFGNVIGSNISNLGLVLGAAAMFSTIRIQGTLVRREIPLLLLATTMTMVMALDGPLEGQPAAIGRTDALILALTFFIFVYIIALDIIRVRQEDVLLDEIGGESAVLGPTKSRYCWFMVVGGFVLLMLGGEFTVRNGVALATQIGVSEAVVGLFVVAVGTSMPELVTSIIAAMRKEADLALGNVIGSNLFNSLMVLPTSGAIAQLPVPKGGVGDLVVSWLLAAALIPLFFYGRAMLGRISGGAFLLVYFGYAIYRFVNT
ncbi:MAG: calcium/sodium antiporter [Woeseiaceae bacterium]|nr:calcium/sodium antiporter [Woeseiaceae bacterium]